MRSLRPLVLLLAVSLLGAGATAGAATGAGTGMDPVAVAAATGGALDGHRHRVLVTSDIGGTDPDDYQSMAHLLLYADVLDLEGLVSSPFEQAGKDHILEVIDAYARDFPNLRTHSPRYPTPDALRAMTKQGGTGHAPYSGLRGPSEGSEWIVRCARRDDPRPLHVLVWGALEDLVQALHDAPDILPRLRVYYIGGPNKKWGPDAYQYLATHFPALWIIEANSTYRGYFVGGDQTGDLGNKTFVARHVAGRGAIGAYFTEHLGGVIKMGDTPSLNWLLKGAPADPTAPGWGGRFVRAWDRPAVSFDRLTTAADQVEIFSIVELALPLPLGGEVVGSPEARLVMGNQTLLGHLDDRGRFRFRFSPRDPRVFAYRIASNVAGLDGRTGEITSVLPPPEVALRPAEKFPRWWTDDPSPEFVEGVHHGAKTVSRWRADYLGDFAARMERCARPAKDAPPPFIPAFPGAEGFGARATGGRGGRVIAVTNLDNAGPGSLRAAVEAAGPRTVVFRVSGTIPLRSHLVVRHGDLTLAGQTAPGDGICLRDYALGFDGAKNIIIRHLRVRPGAGSGQGLDAITGRSGSNIIIDHCSASWSIDESVSLYGDMRDFTVQWCLVSESLFQSVHVKGRHGYGGIWGGQNASWHHNLLAHHSSRNPRIVGRAPVPQLLDIRNNVIYNWGFNSTYGGDGDVRLNLVNNLYKPGPATRAGVRSRLANPSKGATPHNWWIAGNVAVGSPEVAADNASGVHPSPGVTVVELRAEAPFAVAPVTTQTAEEAFDLVLAHAGATLPCRDALDARIVEEARTGTATFGESFDGGGNGIIDSPETVGGWPELRSTEAPADTDADGMPDAWEQRHKLDPANPADGPRDQDGDGYTNLEEFLNATDPAEFIDYTTRA